MTKALLKKQLLEVFSWLYIDRKSGKNRSRNGIIGYAVLYLIVFVFLGYMFWNVASSLCAPLLAADLGWLYMALMSLIGIALGVFGSVFNTFSSLYQAKDNDLLLSMPIPASKILLIRLIGVYATGLLYELVVMLPTIIVFFINARMSIAAYIFTVLTPFVLSIFVLTLSCVLGFVVALISSRLKNKNIITVIISLAFIAGYYYVYSKAYAILQSILADPMALGIKVKTILYPFYHMGRGCEGSALSMLIFTVIIAALFAVVYLVLSRSFIRITTSNRGSAKAKYREKQAKAGNVKSALLKKELRRFLASPTYMLNCGLGIIISLVAAVAIVIKGSYVSEVIYAELGIPRDLAALLAAAAVCMMASMNDISAPSVSLEGKTLWLLHSMPVKAADALTAKLRLHLYLSAVPVLALTAAVLWVIRPSVYFAFLLPITVVGFVIMMALAGLFLNLKFPNLNWTSESVPVKQSMSVSLTLFGGWGIVLALGGIYLALARYIGPVLYLTIVAVLLFALSALLFHWIKTKGTRIFDGL